MNMLQIKALCARSGCTVESVRHYENIGLLPPPARAANGYRLYPESTVNRLQFIKTCRSLGFSLEEIKQLLQLQAAPLENCRPADDLLHLHLGKVQEKIAQLQTMYTQLQALADCREGDVAHCKILSGLSAISSQQSYSGYSKKPHND